MKWIKVTCWGDTCRISMRITEVEDQFLILRFNMVFFFTAFSDIFNWYERFYIKENFTSTSFFDDTEVQKNNEQDQN